MKMLNSRQKLLNHLTEKCSYKFQFGDNELDFLKAHAAVDFIIESIMKESRSDADDVVRSLNAIQNIIHIGMGKAFILLEMAQASKSDHNDFRQRASDIFQMMGKLIGLDEFYDYDRVLQEIVRLETEQQLTKIKRGSQDDRSNSESK